MNGYLEGEQAYLRDLRSPWLLTTYLLTGMILQVHPLKMNESHVKRDHFKGKENSPPTFIFRGIC